MADFLPYDRLVQKAHCFPPVNKAVNCAAFIICTLEAFELKRVASVYLFRIMVTSRKTESYCNNLGIGEAAVATAVYHNTMNRL